MRRTLLIVLLLFALCCVDGKKLSRSRGTSRGSSRKTSYNPQPTSFTQPKSIAQPSAPKSSLFGWQEKPAQRKSSPPRQNPHPQSKQQPQTHSYPSSNTGLSGGGQGKQSYPPSNTGLSGNNPGKQPDSIQKSSATQTHTASKPVSQSNNQQSHSYPSSNTGLSGAGSASGSGYPHQQGGVSGAAAPPPYSSASGTSYNPQGPPPAYSNTGGYPKQGAGAPPPYSGGNYGNSYQHPAPPPSYGGGHGGGYAGGYGGGYSGGHGGYGGYNAPQMPGYFGNNYGRSVGRSSNILTGVGLAGAGVGTVLTGLALWNLARSTGHHHHTVIYDNRGQPVAVAPANSTEPVVDPVLGDLVNCSLTISNDNATEILGIPCAIATSFTPDADVKDATVPKNPSDNTKCTITVVNKAGREFMTTIPCSILLNTAAENNVTEPPLLDNSVAMLNNTLDDVNGTVPLTNGSVITNGTSDLNINQPIPNLPVSPAALPLTGDVNNQNITCIPEPGEVRDPINPCYAVTSDLSVIPLQDNSSVITTAPSA